MKRTIPSLHFAVLVLFAICVRAEEGGEVQVVPSTCSPERTSLTPAFNYDAPQDWGSLKLEYEKCGTGTVQSPVNVLVNYTDNHKHAPTIKQKLSVLQYSPTTHNFKLKCATRFGECSQVKYRGKTYTMDSVHFHSPSENHLNGRSYPLEMHMVHKSGKNLAVVAVLFEIGKTENKELQHMLDAAGNQHYSVVSLDTLAKASSAETCTFDGSLTTPPCSEGVQWIMSLSVQSASLKQIGEYRELTGEVANNRPLQKLNGRRFTCYSKKDTTIVM